MTRLRAAVIIATALIFTFGPAALIAQQISGGGGSGGGVAGLTSSGGTFTFSATGAQVVDVGGNTFTANGSSTQGFRLNSGNVNIGSASVFGQTSGAPNSAGPDTGLSRVAPAVYAFGQGASADVTGYFQWGGQSRVASDVTFTSTTTLGTVTGLSVNVAAGRTYHFVAYLSFTDAAAGGIKAAIAGTATATAIEYDGWIIDSAANGIKGNTQATALATAVASSTTTGTAGVVEIKGTITVNAAGTLLVQAAQNTSNGTATTIKRGSTFIVQDMP